MVGMICVFLVSCSDRKTEEKKDRWILYSTSEIGDHYYNKVSMKYLSPKVINVWTKVKYSKVGKDRVIKRKKDINLSTYGYEKLDNMMILNEVACSNNTFKLIKMVNYNDEGKILDDFDNPNQETQQIIPMSVSELLLKKVCPEK
jgi:hypothetical protein